MKSEAILISPFCVCEDLFLERHKSEDDFGDSGPKAFSLDRLHMNVEVTPGFRCKKGVPFSPDNTFVAHQE